jgi:uncharacterized Zn finger protein
MGGYCDKCGKYAQPLAKLPDGTDIYRCYDCGHVWGERLVVFDVSFALAEHKVEDGRQVQSEGVAVPIMAAA